MSDTERHSLSSDNPRVRDQLANLITVHRGHMDSPEWLTHVELADLMLQMLDVEGYRVVHVEHNPGCDGTECFRNDCPWPAVEGSRVVLDESNEQIIQRAIDEWATIAGGPHVDREPKVTLAHYISTALGGRRTDGRAMATCRCRPIEMDQRERTDG